MTIDNISRIDRLVTCIVNTEANQCNGADHILKKACEQLRQSKLHYIMERDQLTRSIFVRRALTVVRLSENADNFSLACSGRQLTSYLENA